MRRLDALLRDNAGLQSYVRQAGALAQLQALWRASVPAELRPHAQAAGLKHKRITVLADNGAVAAKLKLIAPSLLKTLQNKGLEVTSIRVEVQVKSARQRRPDTARKINASAAASLLRLAQELPDSPLRAALERLASRS